MVMVTILEEAPWKLLASTDTDPPWVGWIHDSAAGWLAEVVRLRDAGRAAGVEGGPLPALWPVQMQYTRDLVTAIGNVARAINTPIPSFGPWAEAQLHVDAGPDPWPGWGFTSPGTWRYETLEIITQSDQRVRDAFVGREGATLDDLRVAMANLDGYGTLVFDQMEWRVHLNFDGTTITTYLNSPTAPNEFPPGDADEHGSNCAGQTSWNCQDRAVWYPQWGGAETNTWVNTIVPLQWLWEMACGVADELQRIGSIPCLVAACRRWQRTRNQQALNYLANLNPPVVAEAPEDLLAVVQRDETARLEVPEHATVIRQIGVTLMTAIPGPVGIVLMLATSIPEVLYRIFGQAQGRWVNSWGEREPAVARASLSGIIDLRHPRAPTQVIPPPPAGELLPGDRPGASVVCGTGRVGGGSLAELNERRRRARGGATTVALPADQTRQGQITDNRGRIVREAAEVDARPRKKKSGAAVAGLAAIALLLAK